ncbi:hypothetical protein ES288_A09G240100v1 [Gossypium darwinii]|uniref:Uncharacterized protein n=1 Tax=Gossypium darwinii TaxID=34276 RepID=A0A5D2FCY0_GOSDA|nr:hypothetical protein ES288_A09G240100v1 [Gossypium darwinii]
MTVVVAVEVIQSITFLVDLRDGNRLAFKITPNFKLNKCFMNTAKGSNMISGPLGFFMKVIVFQANIPLQRHLFLLLFHAPPSVTMTFSFTETVIRIFILSFYTINGSKLCYTE